MGYSLGLRGYEPSFALNSPNIPHNEVPALVDKVP